MFVFVDEYVLVPRRVTNMLAGLTSTALARVCHRSDQYVSYASVSAIVDGVDG